jgi:uncharacterized protein YfaS (alpha-2-macroglobulin family)
MWRHFLMFLLCVFCLTVPFATAATTTAPDMRAKAQRDMTAGNFNDAYKAFSALALDPANTGAPAGEDLTHAWSCLQSLAREDEADELFEKAVTAHARDWPFLQVAASQINSTNHWGFIIAGKFYRGNRHGNDGRYVSSFARDRLRALQLMDQARGLLEAAKVPETDRSAAADFYFAFANILENGYDGPQAWKFQTLTDLTQLPDYDDSGRWWGYGGQNRGAPVDDKGQPVYHVIPKSWQAATTDGQRWRWCLLQAAELGRANQARLVLAAFLEGQFDVQTMAYGGYRGGYGRQADDASETRKDEAGPFAVSTLSEDETIARLANGIKRFKLPDEYNFIKLYQAVANDLAADQTSATTALESLAGIFENRQQYPRAAEYWKQVITRYGPGNNNYRQKRLEQIVGNWAQFEQVPSQTTEANPTVGFRFRNAAKVTFTATRVDIPQLLTDVKAYLKTNPINADRNDWYQKSNINDIGRRLLDLDGKKYLRDEAAKWDVDLKPRPNHFDRLLTLSMPEALKTPGCYLLKADVAGGNTPFVVVWVADTIIVKKQLSDAVMYFLADAATGAPVANATVDAFGWRQRWIKDNNYTIDTTEFAEKSDADGMLVLKPKQAPTDYQWLMTATTDPKDGGRFAWLGYSGIWYAHYSAEYDWQYNQGKAFFISDRPVYRPAQSVQWKIWANKAQYDQDGKSAFAGQSLRVQILNPRGEKIVEKDYVADDFGGIADALALPRDAMLGVYNVQIVNIKDLAGGGSFRVEEYKKPEFEVTVDAPTVPVMLGDKITATLRAKYYFGAPVLNAKVKYKVLRSSYSADWFPVGRWDWLFQPGYWWFESDYNWYPGWSRWGCARPWFPWWGFRAQTQPEVVAEAEVPIGADGTVKVDIDTAIVKATLGDLDHKYEISAEVTDESRRTITGSGSVIVARQPFKVYAWVDRGFYRTGDAIGADFCAQTLDNKPVKGSGSLSLLSLSYEKNGLPIETLVQKWALDTDEQGKAHIQLKAAAAGQYRLSYTVTDAANHKIEGGYIFVIRDGNFTGKDFRFNDLEITSNQREYVPGDQAQIMINANRAESTVLLFVRPCNGVYLAPRVLKLSGKSAVEAIEITRKDMPNIFVEALTVSGGRVFTEVRQLVVPPEDRVLNVSVTPSATEFKPGEKANLKVKVTLPNGEPFNGSTVVAVYDKSVDYISGGSNIASIKEFFWNWKREHYVRTESSADRWGWNMQRPGTDYMGFLGVFGALSAEVAKPMSSVDGINDFEQASERGTWQNGAAFGAVAGLAAAAPGAGGGMLRNRKGEADASKQLQDRAGGKLEMQEADQKGDVGGGGGGDAGAPSVRKNFADTALWLANVETKDGLASIDVPMPESLTTWKVQLWTLGAGTRVGSAQTEVITKKNLIVRLQAPRFFTQKDEVVLSANVHNYLKTAKKVRVVLEVDGGRLAPIGTLVQPSQMNHWALEQTIDLPAGAEKRVDWRVFAVEEGTATVRIKGLTDEESDAMEMSFPVYVHGMLKTDSFSGALRPEQDKGLVKFTVPAQRRIEQSRFEARYSPSVAAAMVDALPYLVEYPYGCTEQTLNRFVPTVITQNILLSMKLNLKDIRDKRSNLNAQEIGDDKARAAQWKHWDRNPVFDEAEVATMVKEGVTRLTAMQLPDGGWGWFSGTNEYSYPHTTAIVVHGLQMAKENNVAVPPDVLARGSAWLKAYQIQRVAQIKAHRKDGAKADNLDAFVYMVLVDSDVADKAMQDYLYEDRVELSVYAKSMFGLALYKQKQQERLAMILQNISQFVQQDEENQTAYLKLPENNWWWCWYGSEYESQAYYLKLLARTDPKGKVAAGLAKYLINNRKHATYWNSTRDTALCIEALADFVKASGEAAPNLSVQILLDGQPIKTVKIDASNLFTFDNKFVLTGADVTSGSHTLEFVKTGASPLYYNAYLTNFTLEDPIAKAGLEIKVQRKIYKLVPVDKRIAAEGAHGQVLSQKVEKYERQELANMAQLKSGDMVEVELEIDSKNDYEYIVFEDMKAAGFEAVELRSGYIPNDLNAFVEFRDERVCFFVRELARGKHSVSYRLRAEIPGKFSALPTKASAMYAPELRGNSDEIKLQIAD